jgi:DNA processing protein
MGAKMADLRVDEWTLLCLEHAIRGIISGRSWARDCTATRVVEQIRDPEHLMSDGLRLRLEQLVVPPIPDDVILRSDPAMPDGVRNMGSPPWGVHTRGNQQLVSAPVRVGIVGSRHPRSANANAARQIASSLARAGCTVVSGLAIGIDGIAHRAAHEAGGTNIAVLGSGCDCVYPASNRRLARDMVESGRGLLVSEYARDSPAYPMQFVARNRIIAGLSHFLIVIQARSRSGSMSTVDFAQSIGLEIGVVPGTWGDPEFEGSRTLAREGAAVIEEADDVFRALGLTPPTSGEMHEFGSFLDSPRTPDELARFLQRPLTGVLEELVNLQVDGLVERTPDGLYVNVAVPS